MRSYNPAAILALFALAASAQPALAKTDRAAEIVASATVCDALLADPAQVAATLRSQGWKTATPMMGGLSMAAITGSEQYRKGRDTALISATGSMVGPNCQFDFAKVSEQMRVDVQGKLIGQFGEPTTIKQGQVTWKRGDVSVSLVSQSPDTATILWLPKKKAQK